MRDPLTEPHTQPVSLRARRHDADELTPQEQADHQLIRDALDGVEITWDPNDDSVAPLVEALRQLVPYATTNPDIRGGEPCIKGTRVPMFDVAALLADGVPTDQIGQYYPSVSAACGWDTRRRP